MASSAPHAAALGVRLVGGLAAKPAGALAFDVAIFGADEALAKSPFSSAWAVLAPGVLAARYAQHFFDTNPIATTSMMITFVAADVAWWLRLAFGATTSVVSALEAHLLSLAASVLIGSLIHVLFFFVPNFLADWIFYGFLLATPFLAARRLYNTAELLRVALKAGGRWGVVDAAKSADIAAAIAVAENKLFSTDAVTDRYKIGSQLGEGEGAFGAVHEGVHISSGEAVAIKYMKVREPPSIVTLLIAIVAQNVVQGGSVDLRLAEAAVRRLVKVKDDSTRISALHEVRGLIAARMALNRSLISFRSAHFLEGGSKFAIVTQLAGGEHWPSAMKGQPMAVKLKSVSLALSALADLHAAGVVHKDIKPDNVNTLRSDPTVPIILDMGVANLPGVADPFPGISDPRYQPPELHIMEAWARGSNTDTGSSTLGFPADVWAMGLTILDVFAPGMESICFYCATKRLGIRAVVSNWSLADARAIVKMHCVPESSALEDLLVSMLHPDPALRITARDAARHRVFGERAPAELARETVHSMDLQGIGVRIGALMGLRRRPNISRLALLRNALAHASTGVAGAHLDAANTLPRLRKAIASLGGAAMHLDAAAFGQLIAAAGFAQALPLGHVELFELLDETLSGQLDKRQALMGLAFVLAPFCDDRTRLRLAFDACDLDGSGSLSVAELRDFFEHFGPTFTRDAGGAEALRALRALQRDAEALFARLDADHDGSVSFEEFEAGVLRNRDLSIALFGDVASVAEVSGAAGGAGANPTISKREKKE